MSNLKYRNATINDLKTIIEIYNSTIPSRLATADTETVSVESRISWFNEHHPKKRPLWIVENEEDEIIGWVSFQNFYGRPAYNETAEISIYLHSNERGKGLGKTILQHCIEQCPALGIKTLLGFIFQHNEPSIQLFRNLGFEDWATLPNIAKIDNTERTLKILGKRIIQ